MKKYLLIAAILCVPIAAFGWGIGLIGSGGSGVVAPTYLIGPIDFESGTYSTGNIVSQDGWTGNGDAWLISTGQSRGSQSLMGDVSAGEFEYVEKTFTARSGTFTINYWIYLTNYDEQKWPLILDSAYSEGPLNQIIRIQSYGNPPTIKNCVAGSCSNTSTTITINGWHEIKIVADTDADTYDLYVDNMSSAAETSLGFNYVASQVTEIALSITALDMYIDDLSVYY